MDEQMSIGHSGSILLSSSSSSQDPMCLIMEFLSDAGGRAGATWRGHFSRASPSYAVTALRLPLPEIIKIFCHICCYGIEVDHGEVWLGVAPSTASGGDAKRCGPSFLTFDNACGCADAGTTREAVLRPSQLHHFRSYYTRYYNQPSSLDYPLAP
jgi:hypothetical protein